MSTKCDSEAHCLRSFDFPEGGWECSTCSNYNFKGRKQCYRCKKDFSQNDMQGKPKHMLMQDEEKAALKASKILARKQRNFKRNKQRE